jgi:uncharacterized surface protein with fasciclin (FAS1) repeats
MPSLESILLPIAPPSFIDGSKSIVEVAKGNPSGNNLETFVDLLEEFELNVTLSEPGNYTVFAPTSGAFLEDSDISPSQFLSVLNYHIVAGIYPESLLVDNFMLITLQGEILIFTSSMDDNAPTMVNDKNIITANILANNGIVHIIDGVLIPDK